MTIAASMAVQVLRPLTVSTVSQMLSSLMEHVHVLTDLVVLHVQSIRETEILFVTDVMDLV